MKTLRKSEMKDYLINHFRYWTMNSWNRSTSYARNVKIYNVIPPEYQDKAFELLDVEEYWYVIRSLIRGWQKEHRYQWQIGFNGRSGEYLVLYKGGVSGDGKIYVQPGHGIDENLEEFDKEDWDTFPLEERYKLVKEFDALCDSIIQITIDYCKNYDVVDEEIQVPRTVKALKIKE